MNRMACAKPLYMPMAAPNTATAMTATSKTVIPSFSIGPLQAPVRLLAPTIGIALTPGALDRAVGRLKTRDKVG